ncbi:hypothetical protein SERLA73DRAFT_180834 [Serpula lacrymans var. lacrymans S7.3]|uniref:Uncharacterized protein n=2 Tax=Serpula lacrymans var. lacrymans TaxID=341189 RepID=F8PWI9_SERL3|nr:uncharacterized protein SERLADRAFT_466614 [Serpula lacrymans var. lacrymans S7.9]EGO00313.1 hypothetical protein SERLA73DRAFT_180834 [Serpula lacrymans var. lacrymans S7.3]EGO25872.1 hypothetical protein SERLADRAFT_466614 [Serpula lacrymans var. lacrymans S7.9]
MLRHHSPLVPWVDPRACGPTQRWLSDATRSRLKPTHWHWSQCHFCAVVAFSPNCRLCANAPPYYYCYFLFLLRSHCRFSRSQVSQVSQSHTYRAGELSS